jgi:hypothetical protein
MTNVAALLQPLRRVRENPHVVVEYFEEAAAHRKLPLVAIRSITEASLSQLAEQGGVPRQNAQVSILAGNLHFVHLFVNQFAFGRHYLQIESHD